MTDSSSSNSLLLIEKGNLLYQQLQGECVFAPVVCRMKLTQAQHYYMEALSHSHTAVGRVSCLKNIGVLHILWTKSEIEQLSVCKFRMISSVDYLLNDLHEGWRAAKPQVWLEYLQRVILSFVD